MNSLSISIDRRAFVAGTGTAALALLASNAYAADPPAMSDAEKANVQVVNDFCAAWATLDAEKICSYMAEDAVFRMSETTPAATGRATLQERFAQFLGRAQKAEFEVLRTAAIGQVVIDERIDRFTMGENKMEFHITGMFFLKDGKIQEWTDYGIPAAS